MESFFIHWFAHNIEANKRIIHVLFYGKYMQFIQFYSYIIRLIHTAIANSIILVALSRILVAKSCLIIAQSCTLVALVSWWLSPVH
jgi:hypothetical protein